MIRKYAQGLGAKSWHMKRQKLSARPTTRWNELMAVRNMAVMVPSQLSACFSDGFLV